MVILSGPSRRQELNGLTELATLFGAGVERVRSLPSRLRRGVRGTVVALGENVAEASKLYAHLTRRDFRIAKDVS